MRDIFIQFWCGLGKRGETDALNFILYQNAAKKGLSFLNKTASDPLDNTLILDRLIWVLKHYEGFDFSEISEMMRLSVNDVK